MGCDLPPQVCCLYFITVRNKDVTIKSNFIQLIEQTLFVKGIWFWHRYATIELEAPGKQAHLEMPICLPYDSSITLTYTFQAMPYQETAVPITCHVNSARIIVE